MTNLTIGADTEHKITIYCQSADDQQRIFRELFKLKQEPCGHERPDRKILCQRNKGHVGSHNAVVFWE